MKPKMELQEAIHLMREEAVRYRRLSNVLADDPLDMDGKCLEQAKRYRQKADALDTLIEAARGGNR